MFALRFRAFGVQLEGKSIITSVGFEHALTRHLINVTQTLGFEVTQSPVRHKVDYCVEALSYNNPTWGGLRPRVCESVKVEL